jgi:hypothetical protein
MTDARYWEQIIASGFTPPLDRSLDEMTVELVELLGDPDPYRRDGLSYRVLSHWIKDGVYDDLLTGLGDGMCEGLTVGLGEADTDTVFRRSFSILIIAAALDRDNIARLLHPTTVMRWGDEGLAWYVKECDLRGWVEGGGWAHAVAHGADFIAALAQSRHVDEGSMMVLLDAIADRLVAPTRYALTQGEDERLAYATMTLLHRNTVDMGLLGPWIERLADSWEVPSGPLPPAADNTIRYVRALHAQLLLGVRGRPGAKDTDHYRSPIEIRVELLGAIQQALRTVGPWYRPRTR